MSTLTEFLQQAWPVILAYVIGATPFGFLAGKTRGIDIRDHGSGNIGATNVLRTLGKPIGITVLILDILKGVAPVVIAKLASDSASIHILAAIATILGHNYTFWLGFKGGKGIATTGGAILPLMPVALGVAALLWILVMKTTRYVSVASLVAAVAIPVVVAVEAFITGIWIWPLLGFALFICAMAFWKHRGNIQRLLRGEEHRFERKSSNSEPTTNPPAS